MPLCDLAVGRVRAGLGIGAGAGIGVGAGIRVGVGLVVPSTVPTNENDRVVHIALWALSCGNYTRRVVHESTAAGIDTDGGRLVLDGLLDGVNILGSSLPACDTVGLLMSSRALAAIIDSSVGVVTFLAHASASAVTRSWCVFDVVPDIVLETTHASSVAVGICARHTLLL